jgi:hypothetical protein
MSDMMEMGGAPPQMPDLGALQEQLKALQAESDINAQGKVKGFLQTGLQDPAAKYNYTEQLGGDVIDYMLESGIDLKKVSMEVAMAKLDEMMAAQEQIVQQLNEYARQHKRELNDAIRQSEDAQDELSAMREVIQKVANKNEGMETPATDSVGDLGDPAAMGDPAAAPPAPEAPAPGGDPMAGGGAPMGDPNAVPLPGDPMAGGVSAPEGGGDMGAPPDMMGGAPPAPPPPQQPPAFAQGGFVGNPRYEKLKGLLNKKRGVVSDQNMKKVFKPSKAMLQGVIGSV